MFHFFCCCCTLQLNPNVNAFQRNFVNEVKRCDDMERRLRFLKVELEKELKTLGRGETLLSVSGIAPPAELPLDEHRRPIFDFDELDTTLEQTEAELREANDSYDDLRSNFLELLETMHVLEKDSTFFDANGESEEASISMEEDADAVPSAHNSTPSGTTTTTTRASSKVSAMGGLKVGYVSGVVLSSKANLFERVLWRALHGNLYFKAARIDDDEIVDPASGDVVEKSVFVVFFHGQQSQIKIRKICDAFAARVVDVPDNRAQRRTMLTDVQNRLRDLRTIMSHGQEQRRQVLARVSVRFADWAAYVRREKSIYNVMNMCNFDAGRKSLIAEGWVPVVDTERVTTALHKASKRCGTTASIMSIVRTKETPPTFFQTNEFTEVFDSVVESYGVATYGEVSPASVSVITFPFLFAIMFGDAGHALMLLIVSVAMCILYPKMKGKPMNEIVDLLMSGRYLLVLMAIFSIYTGSIYNDFFSIGISFFDTCYSKDGGNEECVYGESCRKSDTNCVYPFGIDTIWRRSDNDLYLSNSLKMKLSIVFGVVQMEVGIVLSLFNHLHFKRKLDVFFEFIPQIIFMTSTFGYLVFLIFFKWLSSSITSSCPYLINVFINMFIDFGKLDNPLFKGQNGLQMTLAVLTILSAIAMLIPKPIIELVLHKRKKAKPVQPTGAMFSRSEDEDGVRVPLMKEHESSAIATTTTTTSSTGAIISDSSAVPEVTEAAEDEEEFVFADAFINNAIHSIEFILGCVSNTASYLRLWALSLAHAQLSVVFYEQLLLRGILFKNFVPIFIFWGGWGGITVAILLGMEALSAFLHCLRLHWVEFMNKFYVAEGYAFEPFSFEKILLHINEESAQ